jgi:hypothetical protein
MQRLSPKERTMERKIPNSPKNLITVKSPRDERMVATARNNGKTNGSMIDLYETNAI